VRVAVAPSTRRPNASVTPCVCITGAAAGTLTPSAQKKVRTAVEILPSHGINRLHFIDEVSSYL